MMLKQVKPWYREGLRFECTGCGQCCTGSPGYVWVTEEEVLTMAEHLQLSLEEFAEKYLRQVGEKLSLKELLPSYDCVFFKDKKCTIYTIRPTQCRTYPFWGQNLESKEAWLKAAQFCEGI